MGMKSRKMLAVMLCLILCMSSFARAEDTPKLSKKHDGGAGVEIAFSSDSMIVLENEDIRLSFEKDGSDEMTAIADSEYNIVNSEGKKAYAAVGVVRLLKVEEVGVTGAKEESFVSGEKLTVDDKEVNGFIYPIGDTAGIVKKSAYDNFSEALYHMEFSGYFDEAFARYGVDSLEKHEKRMNDGLDGVPRRVEKQMWRLSETGTEKLCIVVYNLKFEAGESKTVKNTQRIRASMERATDISEKGTVFSFRYTGQNLESFYNVKGVKAIVDYAGVPEPDSFNSKAPFYSDDGKPTLRFSNGNFEFEFSFGKKLGKDEIYDIYASRGYVKKLLDVGAVAVSIIVVLSAGFIVYSVRKRKKSGIGLSL